MIAYKKRTKFGCTDLFKDVYASLCNIIPISIYEKKKTYSTFLVVIFGFIGALQALIPNRSDEVVKS